MIDIGAKIELLIQESARFEVSYKNPDVVDTKGMKNLEEETEDLANRQSESFCEWIVSKFYVEEF